MAVQNKDITYINKDFNDIRAQLINFSQTYFPNTYTDFSPSFSWYDVYRTSSLC